MTQPNILATTAADQLVAIVSVDPANFRATAATKMQTYLEIDTRYHVGAVHVTPVVGDQWIVTRQGTNWRLVTQMPANTTELLSVVDTPVQGLTQVGSTNPNSPAPLHLNGSVVQVNAPLALDPVEPGDPTPPAGTLVIDPETGKPVFSDGESLTPIGGGGTVDEITGLTEALDAKIDKPVPPITPGTGSLITYDENGLIVSGGDAAITNITGLQSALDSKSGTSHTHDVSGGADPLTTKGDILTRDDTATIRKGVGPDGTVLKAASGEVDGLLWDVLNDSDIPFLDCSKIISGEFLNDLIPGLDATKIISGSFLSSLIPGLDATKITSGIFGSGLIPGLDASKIVSGIFGLGNIPALPADQITSGIFGPGLIPGLDAGKIVSGSFLSSLIPGLDAGKIISGSFLSSLIPGLDATKIISGVLGQTQIPLLDSTKVPNLDASKIISGEFLTNLIPGLDATKITSGLFNLAQIPGLDLSKIPGLPASQITSGIFGGGLIPTLDATKIGSGVFDLLRLPGLPAGQITSGSFPQNMITNLVPNLSNIFSTITSPTRADLLQNVPLSSVGNVNPELLINPNYDSSSSVFGGSTSWVWDPTVSHTVGGTGSAKVTANGTILQLLSDPPIPVSPDQALAVSHWLQWSGVAQSGGAGFRLSVAAYLGAGISNTVDVASVMNPAASSGWQKLSGTYVVPATGVDNIRLQLTVHASVTAGNAWWDDGSVKKTQLLRQDWTTALPGDLANLLTGINARTLITDHTSLLSTLGAGSPTLTAITDRLAGLTAGGLFNAASLSNITGIPMVPNTKVTGVGGITDIGSSLQQTWDNVAGAVAGGGDLIKINNRLTNLNTSGLFHSGFLSNIVSIPLLPQAKIPALDGSIIQYGTVPLGQLPIGSAPTQLNRTTLPDVGQTLDQITNAFVGAAGNSFSLTDPGQARQSMDYIYKQFLGLSQKMQDVRGQQTAVNVSGKNVTFNFAEMPDGPAPSDFTTTVSGPGGSTWGIKNGGVGWRTQVNNGNKTCVAVYNVTPTNTDYQIIRATLSGAPPGKGSGSYPYVYGIARVDNPANPQNYVWCRGYCTGFLSYQGDFGCTIAGVDTVWITGVPLTWSMDINIIVGVGGNPRRHQVFSGTELVKDFVEPGTLSKLGAGFRYWGMKSELKTDSGSVVAPPFVVGTSVSDNQPPAVVGSSFRAYRASTGNVTFSGINFVPSVPPFFDTMQYKSDEMGWDGANVTIGIEGTYLVNIRYKADVPGGETIDPLLALNGGLARRMGGGFGDSFGTSPTGIFGSAIIYCKVNDRLTAGYSVSSNTTVTGETSGTETYFEIALLNRSTA